ncbi:MAG: iron-containing alcohol dehydrogenase [Candidatus Nezhaarchaeota archaeon]|nr:iron-containing alcohol dehydrogenase [Candidatus Nezhaarchaeota archaeon]MCX8141336.1 iron-containing alcohol dehydrogenase [Candidatus Nezhaarchaeota archaeon]MDW8049602.1 iron-containing alcohol dehydrogenase [Nitrososphaerota archaeon]
MASPHEFRGFSLRLPSKVIVNMGSIELLGHVARNFGRRCLVVAGRQTTESGRLKVVEERLIDVGVDYDVYDAFPPEPTFSHAEELAEYVDNIMKSKGFAFVVGFGGGSSLDMAKVASLASVNPRPIEQYIGVERVPRKGLPLILIPTTAGSGSEVSRSIVLVKEQEEIKESIVSGNLVADVAIVDPKLTITMNPKLTAITGIDALSHAIESYMSLKANTFTDPLALEAISLISANLRRAYSNGDDLEARRAMSEAALLAGLAFSNASNCAGHAAAYSFAVRYNIPHGAACGVALPYIMRFNMLAIPERLADIAVAMGVSGELSIRELAQLAVSEVLDLLTDLNMPTSLEELGVPQKDIVELADKMMKMTRLLEANPRKVSFNDARKILESMWHGDVESKI